MLGSPSVTTSYFYDGFDQLLSASGQESLFFSWDGRGNQRSKGTGVFAYDTANRLTSADTGSPLTYSANREGVKWVRCEENLFALASFGIAMTVRPCQYGRPGMPTLTRKGQVTVPKEIRDALGIEPGTEVDWEIENGKAVLRKRIPVDAFDKWQGFLQGQLPAASADEMMEMLRGERGSLTEEVE